MSLPEIRANLVNLNSSVIGVRDAFDLSTLIDPAGAPTSLDGALQRAAAGVVRRRLARHAGLSREKLPLDAVIEGPAILEQLDATTVLEPGDRVRSDATAI